jgi:hypothetical protein
LERLVRSKHSSLFASTGSEKDKGFIASAVGYVIKPFFLRH